MATVEPRQQLPRQAVDLPDGRAVRAELERLYVEHSDRVHAICASIVRNRHEAEDAAQQVFLSALRALRGGTVPRDSGAWLATMARHESWTRASRQTAAPLHVELPDLPQEDLPATVVRRAELAEVWNTIAGLPPTQREALLLREVRGLRYEELADDLHLSRASVRSLLSRARRTLRMQLERGAAALIGPQWLSLFARLFTDNNPALSSAARTAAVGFGALAITSCAVVAPTLTRHPHGHATAPAARSTAAAQRAAASSRTIDATASRSQTAAVEESGFVTSGRRDSVRFDSHDSTVGTNDRRHRRERGRTSADLRGRSGGDPVEGIPSSRVGLDGGGSTDGSGGSTSGRDSTGGGSPAGSSGPADGGSAPSGSASGGDGDRGGSSGGRTEGPSGSADTTSGGSSGFGSLGSGRSLSAAGATGTSGGETSGDGAGSSPGPGSEGSASEPSTIVTSSQGSDGVGGTSSSDGSGSSYGSGGSGGSSGSDGSGGSGAPGGGS